MRRIYGFRLATVGFFVLCEGYILCDIMYALCKLFERQHVLQCDSR